ncbi:hypothetical protein DOTSEDRAFT_28179 [Lecanosticta acicola]|uniref:Flavin reductase like domain-containing protein n=1 Tax=Lecanosticta acicola TaxID=111012 RepID=A0AAI8Z1D6_9PEZI|nr:hypothetical protein DOTSEDRAFT_28179 [Lecanosticta acicola]
MQISGTASGRFYRAFYRWTLLTSPPHSRRTTTQAVEDDAFSIRAHPSASTHSDSRIRRRLNKDLKRASIDQASSVNNSKRARGKGAAPLQGSRAGAPKPRVRIVKHETRTEKYAEVNGVPIRKINIRWTDFEDGDNTEEVGPAELSNHTEVDSELDGPSKLLNRIPFATESERPFSTLGLGTKVIRERSETVVRVDCVMDGQQVEQLRSKYGDLSSWFWNEHVVQAQVQDGRGQRPDEDGIKDLEGRWLVSISSDVPGNVVRALLILDKHRLGRPHDRMVAGSSQVKAGDYIVQHRDGDHVDVKFALSNTALMAAQKEYGPDLQLLLELFNGEVGLMASSKHPMKARNRLVHSVFISGTHADAEILIDHLSEFTWCDSTPVGEESTSSTKESVTPPAENLNVEAVAEDENDPLAGFRHLSRIEAPARRLPLYTHVLRKRKRDFAEVEVVLPDDKFDQFMARNSLASVHSRYDVLVKVGKPELLLSNNHPAPKRRGRSFRLQGHPQGVRDACFWLKDVFREIERSDTAEQGKNADSGAPQAAKPSLARSDGERQPGTEQDKTATDTFGSSRDTFTSTPRAINQVQVRDSGAGHDSAGKGDSAPGASKQDRRFMVHIGPGNAKRQRKIYMVLRRFVKGLPNTKRIPGLTVSLGKIFIEGPRETVMKARLLLEDRLAQEVRNMQISLVPAELESSEPLPEEAYQRVKVQVTAENTGTSQQHIHELHSFVDTLSQTVRLPMHHYAQHGQLYLVSTPEGLQRLRKSLVRRVRQQDPKLRVELQPVDMNATMPEVPAAKEVGDESVPGQDAGNNETRVAPPQAQTAPTITRDALEQQQQWEDEAETVKSKAADSSALYKRKYSIGEISLAHKSILRTVKFEELRAIAMETSCSSCSRSAIGGDIFFEVMGNYSSLVRFDDMLKARLRIVCQSSGIPSPEVKFEESKAFTEQTSGNKTASQMAEYLQEAARVSDEVRTALRTLTHPVVVITSQLNEAEDRKHNQGRGARAVTVSSFNTVALKPQAIVSFNLKVPSRTWDAISASNELRIHLMAASPAGAAAANIFTQAHDEPEDGFSQLERLGVDITYSHGSFPPSISRPDTVIAHIRAHLMPEKCVHVGDHVIVVARVSNCYLDERSSEDSEAVYGLAYGKKAYRGGADEIRLPEPPSAEANSHSSTGGQVRDEPSQPEASHDRSYAEPQYDFVFDLLRATRDASERVPSRQKLDVHSLLSGITADGLGGEGYSFGYQHGWPQMGSQPRGDRTAQPPNTLRSGKQARSPGVADSNAAESMPQVADTPLWGAKDVAREDSERLAENEAPRPAPAKTSRSLYRAISGKGRGDSSSTFARGRPPGFSAKRFFSSSSQKPKVETRTHEIDARIRDQVEPSAMKMNVADYLCIPEDRTTWKVNRARALRRLKREARQAERRLRKEEGMCDADRAELRDMIERSDRIISKKLAKTAADDVRTMLDKGRVYFERAQFMESAIEKGLAVVLEEAKLVRQQLEQGKIDMVEFGEVKEELESFNAVLTTEANRLRQYAEEYVDGPPENTHGDNEGGEKFDGFQGNR